MPSEPGDIRAEIVAEVETALADGRSAVLVGGAGIGKTTVARAVEARSPRRFRRGQALAPVAWIPFLPLARAVGRPLTGSKPDVTGLVVARVGTGVLAIDDLQWADPDTLDLLPALAERIPVLGCLRSDDPAAAPLRAIVEQWAEVVPVEPLDSETAARVAERANPKASAVDVAAIVAASGGNPLLLSTPIDPGEVGQVVGERLVAIVARASPDARRDLARLWLGALDVSRAGVAGFSELDRLGLVTVESGFVRPRHALLGAAAADLLGADGRAELHAELAVRSVAPGAAARHLLEAGDTIGARTAALAAAEGAVTDHERADHLLVAARASDAGDPVLLRAASELIGVVRIAEARDVVLQFLPTSEIDRWRRSALDLQTAYWTADTDAVQAGLESLAAPVAAGSVPPEVEVVFRCVRARYLARVAWDPAGAILEAEQALSVAEANGLEVSDPLSTLGSAALVTGDARWREWLEQALVAARSEGRVSFEFVAVDTLFMGELMRGDAARCVTIAERTIERAREQGAVSTLQQHRKNRLLAWGTVMGDAEAVVSEARDLLRLPLNARVREHTESQLAIALADLGRDDDAVEVLAGSSAFTSTDPTTRAMVVNARAEADWLAGRFDGAYEAAEACRKLPIGDFPPRVTSEPLRQWAALEIGVDPGEVLPTPGFENLLAAALESAGIVATARDPHGVRAERSLLEAAETWLAFSVRLARRARWGAGHAAGLAGRPEVAIGILEPLHEELVEAGWSPLLRRVRRSLRAAGLGVPIIEGRPLGPLSGAQVTVLDLVARGLRTDEIARRLLVGTETVNAHAKAAMRKLGVPTRVAAALELSRLRGDRSDPETGQVFVLGSDTYGTAGPRVARVPTEPWSLAGTTGALTIGTADDVRRAVLVAIRGASLDLSLHPDLPRALRAELTTALERIGTVTTGSEGSRAVAIDPSLRRALEVLATGGTAPVAADVAGVSTRTLYRRIGDLRRRFALDSNNELIARIVTGASPGGNGS